MKTIKKLSVTLFALALMVACFMSTTLSATATSWRGYCPSCGAATSWNSHDYCSSCAALLSDTHTHSYGTGTYSAWSKLNDTQHKRTYTQTCTSTTGTCTAKTKTTDYTANHTVNSWGTSYQQISGNLTQHQRLAHCNTCNADFWKEESHNWQYTDTYQQKSDTQHQRQMKCSGCGMTKWVDQNCSYANHNPMEYKTLNTTQHQYRQDCRYCGRTRWINQTCSWVSFNPMQYQKSTNSQHQYKQYCRYCNRNRWVNQNHSMVAQNNPKDGNGELAYRSFDSATQCERKWVCSTCGYTEWRKVNHSFAAADPWAAIDATQHQNRRTCNNCKCSVEYQTAKHSFTNQLVGGTDGHYTVQMCTACAYTGVEGKIEAHTYGNWSYTTSNGMKIGTRTCSKCKFMDQENEIIGPVQGLETANVLSDPMTLEQIRANAGTKVTSPAWKAAIGASSTFEVAKASTLDYAWTYNNVAYGLSKRPDGLYYVVQLPSYYWSRVANKYPNGTPTYGGGGGGSTYAGTSTTTYDTTKNVSYGTVAKDYSGSGSGNTNAAYNAMISVIKAAGGAVNVKPGASSGGYTVATDSKGNVKYDSKGYPMMSQSTPVYVHSCSYSYSYRDVNDTVHEKTTTSCCGGSSKRMESHNYGSWTYTDIGPERHRAERVCKNCGHVDVQYQNHVDKNTDGRCDQCARVISVQITWRWYDEHTPVTDTTRQYYYRGLVTPPVRGRMDYKFTGWFTKWGGNENGGVEWVYGQNFPYGSPTELFASWKAIVELVFDLSAPVITVTRAPADIDTPIDKVTLTITAVDPDGNDHDLPLQIEGETTWHASPWVLTVDRSKQITIVARDTKNNTRQFVVDVNNVDTQPPVIVGVTSNVKGWTKDPVTMTVSATDDIKLAATPYQWEFTPNSTGKAKLEQWTAVNTYTVAEAGKVRVQVRDAVGNATWSDYISVDNVDTIAPNLNSTTPYTLDTTETVPASRGVTVTLNIQDIGDPVTNLSSGLAPDPIKWPDEVVFGKSVTKTLYANGTYNVVLQDAVGNTRTVEVVIRNISTDNPTVNNFYAISEDGKTITGSASSNEWYRAPFTLVVDADFGAAGADDKSYSWDGGLTWTSLNTHVVNTNGEYTVMIRDKVGTVVSQSIVLDNTDATKPVVGMYLYKGLPEDWTDPDYIERDYVWKMRIEAEDLGSGIKSVYTQWDDKTYGPDELPIIFDVKTPGSYQVTVTDNAGNQVQAEKVAQWTDLGENVDGPNPNVPVISPEPGTGGAAPNGTGSTTGSGLGPDGLDWGTAGYPYNANLEDLVFGPDGAYNTKTGEFIPYPAGMAGIPVNFNAHVNRNKWATAYVTFNGVKYPATFAPVPTPFNSSYSNGISPVKGTGDPLAGHAFIPIADIKGDMKNARITVTVNEWNDQSCTGTPNRVGTENFYTSAQLSKPVITYVYNQVTEELTISATSAIAGIEKIEYSLDGGTTWRQYDGNPVVLTDVDVGSTIVMRATDKLGQHTDLAVSVSDLGLNGGAGGGSLPADDNAEGLPDGTNSHHSSNRAADIYIIGGTRSNTTQVPNSTVFNYLTGSTAAYAGN